MLTYTIRRLVKSLALFVVGSLLCSSIEAQETKKSSNLKFTSIDHVLKSLREKGKKSPYFFRYTPNVILAFDGSLAPLFHSGSSVLLSNIDPSIIDTFQCDKKHIQLAFRDTSLLKLMKSKLLKWDKDGVMAKEILVSGITKAYFFISGPFWGKSYFAILQNNQIIVYRVFFWMT